MIDSGMVMAILTPLVGAVPIQHLTAAFKNVVPDKYLPLIAVVMGLVISLAAAFGFGYGTPQGFVVFALLGLTAGSAACGGASAVKAAGQSGTPPQTTVETVLSTGAVAIGPRPAATPTDLGTGAAA